VRATIGGVTTARATAVLSATERQRSRLRSLPFLLLPAATALTVLGLALLLLLSPLYMHTALDMADAPRHLGLTPTPGGGLTVEVTLPPPPPPLPPP